MILINLSKEKKQNNRQNKYSMVILEVNMKEESWFYRLLKRIGLIKTYEVSKKEMCERAKSICSKNCESCAWYEEE